jgi:membrane-bound lytic murein transglycosylase B
MGKQILKRLIVGGALLLATSSALGARQVKEKPPVPQEKKIASTQRDARDPFMPPKNLSYLSRQPETTINSLDELAKRLSRDGVDRRKVMSSYGDERFRIHPNIYDNFKNNPENTLPYLEYRQQLGLDKKIENAPGYFKEYATHLFMAEDRHLVDAPTILAIMGVESDFLVNPGKFRAFNAGVSLYLSPKKEFAYRQLKALFGIEETISKKKKFDIMELRASYADCSGPGQFLLENILRYFVGMNNKRDDDIFLLENWFYAIAHFVHENGWDGNLNYQNLGEGSANWKVLLRYNNADNYVRAVIELADSLKNNPEIRKLIQEHEDFKRIQGSAQR